jgi:hypothetical protein
MSDAVDCLEGNLDAMQMPHANLDAAYRNCTVDFVLAKYVLFVPTVTRVLGVSYDVAVEPTLGLVRSLILQRQSGFLLTRIQE